MSAQAAVSVSAPPGAAINPINFVWVVAAFAVVAAAMGPAAQGDGLVELGNVQMSAVMGSHNYKVLFCSEG